MNFSTVSYAVLFLALSCGGSGGGGSATQMEKSEKFTYNLSYNGCATGTQSYSNKADYCMGLQNDEKNKGCATGLRINMFDRDCADEFKWYESAKCELLVLTEKAGFPYPEQKDILEKVSVCAGHTESVGWKYISGMNISTALTKYGIIAEMEVEAGDYYEASVRLLKIDGIRNDSVIDKITFRNNLGNVTELGFGERKEKVLLRCYKTFGCPK